MTSSTSNHGPTGHRLLAGALAAVLAAALPAARTVAQQSSIPGPDSSDVYRLQLVSVPEVEHGKVAIVEGLAWPAAQKLALADLSVLQPVEISLFTPSVNDDVRLELSKFILDQPARSGSTKGTAATSFKFRTQGDVQIKIVSPDGPNPYRLFVWVGDEVTPEMPAPFISMETYQKRTGRAVAGSPAGAGAQAGGGAGGTPLVLWVIALALVAIVGLLTVMVLRRRRA